MKLTKFSPKKEHLQREKYGLLAETLDEPVKAKKFGGLKLAKIDPTLSFESAIFFPTVVLTTKTLYPYSVALNANGKDF